MSNLKEQGRRITEEIGKCDTCFYYWEVWDDPGAQDCSLPSARMCADAGCDHPFVSLIDEEWCEEWGGKELCPLWASGFLYCGKHNSLFHKQEAVCPECENEAFAEMYEDDLNEEDIE